MNETEIIKLKSQVYDIAKQIELLRQKQLMITAEIEKHERG